jgi:predicted Zn-dependent peptidase
MCGSRDLIEITNESISTEKNSLNNIEEIKKLKELLDDGIISQKEFEKKKKQLLDL